MKNIRVVLSPEAQEVYKYLNENAERSKTERMILKTVNHKNRINKTKYSLW